MIFSPLIWNRGEIDKIDVAVIKRFTPKLEKRYLRKEGTVWYADFYLIRFLMKLPHLKTTLKVQKRSYSKLLRA
jgi:hypothetical protein